MTRAVALLRGVNVGGKSALSMADLVRVAAAAGLADPQTYLQSGNLVFTTGRDAALDGVELAAALRRDLGLVTEVIVRSSDRLAGVAAGSPFDVDDPRFLHVVFLAATPAATSVSTLDPDRSPPDAFHVDGDHIYVSYPSGSGRSKLSLDYFERQLGVTGTARNWNTVTNLLAMVG